jgi:hypothetical protein
MNESHGVSPVTIKIRQKVGKGKGEGRNEK